MQKLKSLEYIVNTINMDFILPSITDNQLQNKNTIHREIESNKKKQKLIKIFNPLYLFSPLKQHIFKF